MAPHPYIDSRYVKAFNPTTGADVWRYPTSGFIGGIASTPAVFTSGSEKRVVIGCMDGKVYCLNA
jgi:outer membrane protein assembly factor BamB